MVQKKRDILGPLPQGGDMYGNNIEPVIQILSEYTFFAQFVQIIA